MASFFRWRIANKVIPFLVQGNANTKIALPSVISSLIKVNRRSWKNPQLHLSWKKITNLVPEIENFITPSKLVTFLRNQGLPTSEGFTDIGLTESPLGLIFTVDKHVYSKIVLTDIYANDENMAKSSCLFQNVALKKVLVQYNFPTIGDIFSMSDFRTIIHANFIANINQFVGNDVLKMNISSDWDFQSALILTRYKDLNQDDVELHKNPSDHLLKILKMATIQYENDFDFRLKVDMCFENLKNGDEKVSCDWHDLKNLCQTKNKSLFKKLGLNVDDVIYTSCNNEKSQEIFESLIEKNVFSHQPDDNVKISLQEELNTTESLCFKRTDSLFKQLCCYIYSIKVAEAEHKFDAFYFVGSSSQKMFFSILIGLIKKLGFEWSDKLQFIELCKITDFDSLKRKNLSAEEILKKANLLMLNKLKNELYIESDENLEALAESVSYASVLMFDMKHKRNLNYSFKWKEIIHFGKDSGASFQLCHAGLKGLQEDTEFKFKVDIDTSPLSELEAQKLIIHLSRFDEIIYKTYVTLQPYHLYQYLSSLWYYVDAAANVLKLDIRDDRLIVIKARLLLLSATLKILQKSLTLLGLKPFENKYVQPKL